MGKLACSPIAFARAISLQRANARAKSCRSAETGHLSCDAKPVAPVSSQLSKRIDVMLMNISSGQSATQSKAADEEVDEYFDVSPRCSAIKVKSLSQDMQFSDFKSCFASLSERMDRGLDLWDREFSSMSSHASDQTGFLCGLQRRLDSFGSSQLTPGAKVKRDDASSSNSWSEASFNVEDMMQVDDKASYGCNGSECRTGPKSQHWPSIEGTTGLGEGPAHKLERGNKLAPISNIVRGGSQLHQDKSGKPHGSSIRKGHCDRMSTLEEDGIGIIGFNTITGRGADRKGDADEARSTGCKWGCLNAVDETSDNYCSEELAGRPASLLMMKELGKAVEAGAVEALCGRNAAEAELPVNSVAVEKVSVNPEEDFSESMYEMMIEKGDVEEDMEDLLNCYLLLNPVELHQVIREAFSRVWIDMIMTIR